MIFSFFNEKKFLEVEFYSNEFKRTFRFLLQDKIDKIKYDELKKQLQSMPYYFHIRFTDQILWNSQIMMSFEKLQLKIKKYALEKNKSEIVKFKTKLEFIFDFYGDNNGWIVISSFIENNKLTNNLAVRNLSNSTKSAIAMFNLFFEAIQSLEPSLELNIDDDMKSYKILF